MESTRILKYKLNPDKDYTITKLLPDGKQQLKSWGKCWQEVQIGHRLLIGAWDISPIQDITIIGKGLIVETENSTYLIEEASDFDVVIRDDSKE